MVSIAAFQAVDPSSILGHRRYFSFEKKLFSFSALVETVYLCFAFKNLPTACELHSRINPTLI